MTWFERLTGVREESPEAVRRHLAVSGTTLTSSVNGKSWVCGELDIASLADLRKQTAAAKFRSGGLSLRELVADVKQLHRDRANAGSMFQVASQFNLLEMTSPHVTPERGVGIYEGDFTQGPACAVAAGAGTIYRNYFVPVNGRIGQSHDNQVDCLADVGAVLGNTGEQLWRMQNGYALASQDGLVKITQRLNDSSEAEIDANRQLLRVGIQRHTQVTLDDASHLVSQVYCSALPVAYSPHGPDLWKQFAVLILEAAYEATVCAAIASLAETGNNRLFLTLLGGGAFGNNSEWILGAIRRAIKLYAHVPLEVAIVSYGASNPAVRQLTG